MALFRRKKVKVIEIKKPPVKVKVKAGIAFGGGGTRGFAHVGAVKAFEENGIEFSYVAGTSVGSLVGALYACGVKSSEMIEYVKDLKVKDIRNSRLIFVPSNTYNIQKLAERAIGGKTFEEADKPLYIIAVDLKSGEEIVLKSGNIARAISASCAVPGIFKPVIIDDYHLVDGGVINPIPADALRIAGAEKVVSIDLNSTRANGTDSLKMLDILFASFRIVTGSTAVKGVINSDILINPDLSKFKASSPEGMEEMIQIGYETTMKYMDEIKELLKISTKSKEKIKSKNSDGTDDNEEKGSGNNDEILSDNDKTAKVKKKKDKNIQNNEINFEADEEDNQK